LFVAFKNYCFQWSNSWWKTIYWRSLQKWNFISNNMHIDSCSGCQLTCSKV